MRVGLDNGVPEKRVVLVSKSVPGKEDVAGEFRERRVRGRDEGEDEFGGERRVVYGASCYHPCMDLVDGV